MIPHNSSVFCALGLLSADYVMRFDQGVGWDLSKPEGVARVNQIAEQMVADSIAQMESEGFGERPDHPRARPTSASMARPTS